MSSKNTVFYREKKEITATFTAEEISSDGAALLLEKLERKHKLIKAYSFVFPEYRDESRIVHSNEKMLKQRVFLMIHGYEDANDVKRLKYDPIFKDILSGDLASQPTISRFENTMDRRTIYTLSNLWVDKYIESIKGRKSIIIDVDGTDDPTYGNQQLSMFNGYYRQFMYNELFFHDGDTGQIILPVLRPGNSHSNKWFVSILKRIIIKAKSKHPEISITIRADGGFSCAPFYKLADDYNLKFAIGLPSNNRLKKKVARSKDAVEFLYQNKGQKHQHFIKFKYQAKSWHKEQQCYSKVESTGLGMNVRHFVSNIEQQEARDIYFGFYVKRGETSENRIKEVKNMCFSGRLSNHTFWSNFLRLFLSSMAYEFFLLIKNEIKKTNWNKEKKWQISSIRVYLLKVGTTIRYTKTKVHYHFSKAFLYRDLLKELLLA